jgi:hypothetical protein
VVDDGGVSGVELESSPCVGFSSMLYTCATPGATTSFWVCVKILEGFKGVSGLLFRRTVAGFL